MKLIFLSRSSFIFLIIGLLVTARAAPKQESSGIAITPSTGEINELENGSGEIRVTFPAPMVDLDNVKRGGQPCPIVFDPVVELRWLWVSQTEGIIGFPEFFTDEQSWIAQMRIVAHRAKLRPGLKDLAGHTVDPQNWGAEFAYDKFELRGLEFLNVFDFEEKLPGKSVEAQKPAGESQRGSEEQIKSEEKENDRIRGRAIESALVARPRVRLEFSRDVLPQDVQRAVYFQDSESHKRFPIEVSLEERQKAGPQGWVLVEPIDPLPPRRSYLLVMDPIQEPNEHQALPHILVVPAGTTYPLAIQRIAGLNQPLVGPMIRLTTNQQIDPDPVNLKHISIKPSIPKFQVIPNEDTLDLIGDFSTSQEYTVAVNAGLKSTTAVDLPERTTWKVHFHPKRPAIILPEEQIFQRVLSGAVSCSFVQVNTSPLEWKLARIPRVLIREVQRRLREFEDPKVSDKDGSTLLNPKTGEYEFTPTELLIPALELPVVASGNIPASADDKETDRQIEWKPAVSEPSTYLLEITGSDNHGRQVGNRTIISQSNWAVSQVDTSSGTFIRLANMKDGMPAEGVMVQPIKGKEDGPSTLTDLNGETSVDSADGYLIGAGDQVFYQPADLPTFTSHKSHFEESENSETLSTIVTDRNVYRPGETVMLKGFVRVLSDGKLSIPASQPLKVTVTSVIAAGSGPIYESDLTVSSCGSWQSTWPIPLTAFGDYYIDVDGVAGGSVKITVGDFRPPAFSVNVETSDGQGDTARARVTSIHFHGAPNAGAKVRWKAEWLVDNWSSAQNKKRPDKDDEDNSNSLNLGDEYSSDSRKYGVSLAFLSELSADGWDTERQDREVSISATAEGETTLDSDGRAVLECKSPFPPDAGYGRVKVFWIVDVTSASAETLRGGAVAKIQFVPSVLGVGLSRSVGNKQLDLQVSSFNAKDEASAGTPVKAEVFKVNIKTVKERIGRNLSRYRNFPAFERVWQGDLVTPAKKVLSVPSAGHYVVSVTAPTRPYTPRVSDEATVYGGNEASVEVDDEHRLSCRAEKNTYKVGETAAIDVESPIVGVATVTVETNRILWQKTLQLDGNLQQIAVPIFDSFAPNARVCVHVIRTGDVRMAPSERFGSCAIKVERPSQHLQVVAIPQSKAVEPGAYVSGMVKVLCESKPVAGADVMLFAVDEAVIALGRWHLPDFEEIFFPPQPWTVATHVAFGTLWTPQKPERLSHSQKGFIIGDGGPKIADTIFRKDFKPLAFWNANLRTNVKGEVPFRFKAPDSLTSYRIVAVAQKGADQFGRAQSNVQLSKKLQIEPALPQFLRNGDEVLLRAVVRQSYRDFDKLELTIFSDPGIHLLEPQSKRLMVKRGEQALVSFRARVADHGTLTKVRFSAKSTQNSAIRDGVAESLSIHPSELELTRAIFGAIESSRPLDVTAVTPREWLSSNGHCDVMLSGSQLLPKLAGLPAMFEGGGSFEKLSTRILSSTLLSDTLAFLPIDPQIDAQLQSQVEEGLRRLRQVAREEGVPVWVNETKPNEFTTIQAAWAIRSAAQHNIIVDQALLYRAEEWLTKTITKEVGFDQASPDSRCFALMVWASTQPDAKVENPFADQAQELFANRQLLGDEGRAWLALALHYLNIMSAEKDVLMRESETLEYRTDFDPITFSSKIRVDAIHLLAQSEIQSTNWSTAVRDEARQKFESIAKSSIDLSTQENLWLLLLLNSITRGDIPAAMADRPLVPKPPRQSKNRISVGWVNVPLNELPRIFAKPLQPKVNGSYFIRAVYQQPQADIIPADASLTISRVVRNLSSAGRTGTTDAPYQVGDQILITYQLSADRAHSYLELEDQLPACFETVNAKMPLIAQYFQLPFEAGVNTLPLSHVELRFARTLLYFDTASAGRSTYSMVARVTSAGSFHWPGTQVRPMYDSRFLGVSGSQIVYAQ